MSAAPARPSRLLATLGAFAGLCLLVGSAVWVIRARAHHAAVEPDDRSLAAAAASIGAGLRNGDGLVFSPGWAADQRWRFVDVWRKHGLDLDSTLILGDPVDLWDADGFARLWVVTTHDYGKKFSLPAPARLLRRSDMGHGTAVFLFDVGGTRTAFDFRKRLADASVQRQQADGSFTTCTWRGAKFDCGGEGWQDIWQGLNEVGNTRRECIYVQPHRDGGILRLVWTHPPPARVLAGRVGNRLWAVRHEEGADLRLRVRVANRVVFETALAKDDFVYHPWQAALRPEEAGADVAFEFSTDNIQWRQACFDARLLDATRAAVPASPAAVAPIPQLLPAVVPAAQPLRRPVPHARPR